MTKEIKSICFITPEYPVEGDMTNTFVDALICEIARQGIKCTVIAPFDVFRYLRHQGKKRPRHWTRVVNDKVSFEVFAPPFFAFTGHKGIADISQSIYNRAALNEYKRISETKSFDAVYGHFFGKGGIPAELIGEKYGIPAFVACGESSLEKYQNEKQDKFVHCIENITGIICVSSKNKDEIFQTWGKNFKDAKRIKNKITVIPNAFNSEEFYPMSRDAVRAELGIDKDEFIVSYLGRFVEHKGISVLNEALKRIGNVGAIFIGSGNVAPDFSNVYFSGKLDHKDVAKYLNASDIFVLPTKAEGCSNAIVEALACGLPVISSDLPFNYDILDSSNSILVDPESVDDVYKAIMQLKNNPDNRKCLGLGAVETGKSLRIEERAKKIVDFMSR